jgi:hypothetical protein
MSSGKFNAGACEKHSSLRALGFGRSVHYELRDIQSERLIKSADVPQPCGQNPNPPAVPIPNWVRELKAAQKSLLTKPKA